MHRHETIRGNVAMHHYLNKRGNPAIHIIARCKTKEEAVKAVKQFIKDKRIFVTGLEEEDAQGN